MVNWSEKGPLRVIMFWNDNLLCFWHLVGFIFTIILFTEFRYHHLVCEDSFFAYNHHDIFNNVTTTSCHMTSKGEHITYSYFIFTGFGLMVYLYTFYYLIILETVGKDTKMEETPAFYFGLFFIPIYISSVACTSFFIVYPKIFLKSDAVQYFHRMWMGYTTRECTSWLILIAQTAYFVENALELTILSGVFLSHF